MESQCRNLTGFSNLIDQKYSVWSCIVLAQYSGNHDLGSVHAVIHITRLSDRCHYEAV